MSKLSAVLLGDAMIPSEGFRGAWEKYLSRYGDVAFAGDWETSWDKLQYRRLEVEKKGPLWPVPQIVGRLCLDCSLSG